MRPFELALCLSCLLALALAFFGSRVFSGLGLGLLFVPSFLLALHAWLEGVRVHLAPVYLAAGALALCGLVAVLWPGAVLPQGVKVTAILCGLALAVSGFALGAVFPVFQLPKPPGPHSLGTLSLSVPNDRGGSVRLQLWYPAEENAQGDDAGYLPDTARLSSRLLSNVGLVRTHAKRKAGAAREGKGWPVILYSPSWDGGRFENTVLCEALASEGFVVAALERPEEGKSPPPLDFSSREALERFQHAADHELALRTQDVRTVVSVLPALQAGTLAEGLFQQRLDLAAVGVMGYSFGGAVAAEACRQDSRLQCGMDLDGILFGQAACLVAKQPFLFITDMAEMPPESELHSPDPAVRRSAEFYAASLVDMDRWLNEHGGWLIRLEGVQHADFCDRPLYARLRRFTGGGPRKAPEVLAQINLYATAFFREILQGHSGLQRLKDRPQADFRHFLGKEREN